eukprot:TRINITY_DN5496_c0_g2_i1.p1 TRINITY_DN5496_c0_g2~~TRINITY_DN5496_c0_g2_i1.p1  ORF type:complete len:685 (-),score=106.20 TRINITY_DN5496_c0_g2_i1:200-2254(-)
MLPKISLLSAIVCICTPFVIQAARLKQSRWLNRQTKVSVPVDKQIDFAQTHPAALVSIEVAANVNASVKAIASSTLVAAVLTVDLESHTFHVESATLETPPLSGTGRVPVAWAKYNNTVSQNGWAYLSVIATDDPQVSDDTRMYAAGFLEGFLSAKQIRDFQHNANGLLMRDDSQHHALANVQDLFGKELAMIREKSGMRTGSSAESADSWWRQARFALLQSWGVLDGYNRQVDTVGGKPMSMIDLMVLSSDGETPELETAYDEEETLLRQSEREDAAKATNMAGKVGFLQRSSSSHSARRSANPASKRTLQRAAHDRMTDLRELDDKKWLRIVQSTGRCSALVRVTSGNRDLLVGHTTFSDYSEMTRIFKHYDLPLQGVQSRRMTFSSYPGVVGSTDDYYIMDSGLVVTETTVSMLSDESYDKLDDSVTNIPDFMRIMMANRLAVSGKDWAELMNSSSSGTYSSQWMVVDYNKFTLGEPPRDGALFVLEQVPGMSHMEDMTARLRIDGYWASENRAWFKDVRDSIGATEAEELRGDLFSADRNPRATIFKATAPQVASLADMRSEMQRNRWPHEEGGAAFGNEPQHAIAARGDLDESNPNPNGAVDSKVTNACLVQRLSCDAISGPTHDSQHPFRWTDTEGRQLFPNYPHDGEPDVWNFDWVRMAPEGEFAPQFADPVANACS